MNTQLSSGWRQLNTNTAISLFLLSFKIKAKRRRKKKEEKRNKCEERKLTLAVFSIGFYCFARTAADVLRFRILISINEQLPTVGDYCWCLKTLCALLLLFYFKYAERQQF